MKMKTLTINGQTFIVVDAEAMRKIADSDLNMKGKLIYDAIIHANKLSFPGLNQDELVDVVSGSTGDRIPMLIFSGSYEGPVLRNIHDGIEDNDAATVGQVKAVENTAIKKNTGASVSYVKILHNLETNDAIDIMGSCVHDASDLVVNVLTLAGDFEGEQVDNAAVILRGIHKGEDPSDAVNKAQLDEVTGNIEAALDSIISIQESLIGTIAFAVGGRASTALKGMTWSEWCDSQYNTIGLYVGDDGIVYDGEGDIMALDDVVQYGTTALVDGADYSAL